MQLGYLIENRIDEVYVLSAPGPLETYVPVHDTGGFDRARTPFGAYDHKLDQVKGTTGPFSSHPVELRINFNALAHPNPDLAVVFAGFDLAASRLREPLFVVPSEDVPDVCTRHRCATCGRTHWQFVANMSGHSRDRASRYQVGLAELAPSRWPSWKPRLGLLGLSTVLTEVGTFFERQFDADFLAASTGDEVLMAPAPDLFGRDRLVLSKTTRAWVSLAIKGSTATSKQVIEANVPRRTFLAHPRHYLLIQHYERDRSAFHPWTWLMSSGDFQSLATGRAQYLHFATSLNATDNRWAPFRIPTASVGAAVRDLMRTRAARRAA